MLNINLLGRQLFCIDLPPLIILNSTLLNEQKLYLDIGPAATLCI